MSPLWAGRMQCLTSWPTVSLPASHHYPKEILKKRLQEAYVISRLMPCDLIPVVRFGNINQEQATQEFHTKNSYFNQKLINLLLHFDWSLILLPSHTLSQCHPQITPVQLVIGTTIGRLTALMMMMVMMVRHGTVSCSQTSNVKRERHTPKIPSSFVIHAGTLRNYACRA